VAPSEIKRAQRVGELLRQELSRLLVDGVKDPRVGFVTVTEIRPTEDLRSAKVFVSIYGDAQKRRATLEGLKASAGFLRRELSHRLELRHVPELLFWQDDTLDRAERMDAVFSAIAHGDTELPPPMQNPALPVGTVRSDLAEQAKHFVEAPLKVTRVRSRKKMQRGHGAQS
jgi:ribosome-binding factor A